MESKPDFNEQQIKEIKEDIKDLQKRMLKIEASREKTEFQYDEIMKALNKLNEDTIPNLMNEITELKNKPAKRYEQVVTGILGAIAGAAGTFIASKFLG